MKLLYLSVWEFFGSGLGVEKSAFGVVKLPDGYLDDANCQY